MQAFRLGRKSKKSRNILKIFGLTILSIAVVFSSIVIVSYFVGLKPVDTQDITQEIITVSPGQTQQEVAELLHSRNLIRSKFSYIVYGRITKADAKMQAGSYSINRSMSVQQIIDKFASGDVAVDLITILPAQTLQQIRDMFLAEGYSESVVDDALDPQQYSDVAVLSDKPPLATLEGYLYPESFQKNSNTKLSQIVRMSLQLTQDLLDETKIAALQKQGLTKHDAIIIASIVEKEVSNHTDRPKVAQVFLKRLREGMMLGSDVTAFYGANLYGLEESVFADTPFNTRLYTGLPPGPISNISASSLDAVINPAKTDYLYFVSGDDGVTYFSKTLEEHEALTAQHCIKLCQ